MAEGLENVRMFPNWNKKATAAQRFEELAVMARKNPERFAQVVIGWNRNENEKTITNYTLVGEMDTMHAYGLLHLVALEIQAVTRGP